MKNDRYSKARGGWSRIIDISCDHCGRHVCFYQKDGRGPLKRMYLDRLINIGSSTKELKCHNCKRVLGISMVYKKENRPAYRLFQNSIKKKIVKQSEI